MRAPNSQRLVGGRKGWKNNLEMGFKKRFLSRERRPEHVHPSVMSERPDSDLLMKPGVGRSPLLWESETWEFPSPVERACCSPRRSGFCQSLVSWVVFLGHWQRDSVDDP